MKRIGKILLISLLLSSLLTGCGASSEMTSADFVTNGNFYTDSSMKDSAAAEFEEDFYEESIEEVDTSDSSSYITGDKIVYTCDMSIETLEYSTCMSTIKEKISEYKGFIESENESDNDYRWYYSDYEKTSGTKRNTIIIRIPSKDYENFLNSLEGTGKIVSKYTNAENISKQYSNTQSLIQMYETEESNLLKMLEKATSISDMIEIEARLSEVQYELLIARNNLSSMDSDIEYSTITIRVEEVMEYSPSYVVEPDTFWGKLKLAFTDGWEAFFNIIEFIVLTFVILLPEIITIILIVLVIRKIVKKRKLKKNNKKES